MRQYIYKADGQLSEPLSKEKLEILIRTEELRTDDFVYLTDTKEWKRIYELDEFSSWVLKPEAHEIRRWFKYKAKGTEKEGPFSTKEIIAKLASNEITEQTYLWSYETKEWKKLQDIEDFNKAPKVEVKEKAQPLNIQKKEEDTPKQKLEPVRKTETRLETKLQPRPKLTKKDSNKIKSKQQKNFIPELIMAILLVLLAYIDKNILKAQTLYFYILGAMFGLLGLISFFRFLRGRKQ